MDSCRWLVAGSLLAVATSVGLYVQGRQDSQSAAASTRYLLFSYMASTVGLMMTVFLYECAENISRQKARRAVFTASIALYLACAVLMVMAVEHVQCTNFRKALWLTLFTVLTILYALYSFQASPQGMPFLVMISLALAIWVMATSSTECPREEHNSA